MRTAFLLQGKKLSDARQNGFRRKTVGIGDGETSRPSSCACYLYSEDAYTIAEGSNSSVRDKGNVFFWLSSSWPEPELS